MMETMHCGTNTWALHVHRLVQTYGICQVENLLTGMCLGGKKKLKIQEKTETLCLTVPTWISDITVHGPLSWIEADLLATLEYNIQKYVFIGV